MEQTRKMTPKQHGAVYHAVRIGRILVNDHPEIADMYRKGMSYSEIAENLDVEVEYDASKEVAKNSIYRAIRGHEGSIGAKYGGLISDLDELVGLEHEHYVENGRKSAESINPETGLRYVVEGGIKTAAEGKGIHGLTPEQKSEYSSKGGKIGGIKATLAQGKTLWEKEETEYAHLLSLEPEFQHQKGKHKGKGDYKTIAQVLNVDYHNGEEVRSAGSVRVNLYNYIKTLGN